LTASWQDVPKVPLGKLVKHANAMLLVGQHVSPAAQLAGLDRHAVDPFCAPELLQAFPPMPNPTSSNPTARTLVVGSMVSMTSWFFGASPPRAPGRGARRSRRRPPRLMTKVASLSQ
jgi:hypothetical protein